MLYIMYIYVNKRLDLAPRAIALYIIIIMFTVGPCSQQVNHARTGINTERVNGARQTSRAGQATQKQRPEQPVTAVT